MQSNVQRDAVVHLRPAPSMAVINLTSIVGSAFGGRYTVQVDAAGQLKADPSLWLVQVRLYGRKFGPYAVLLVSAATGQVTTGTYFDALQQADASFLARAFGAAS